MTLGIANIETRRTATGTAKTETEPKEREFLQIDPDGAIVNRLSEFVGEANDLKTKLTKDPTRRQAIESEHLGWEPEVDAFLKANLGESYAARFRAARSDVILESGSPAESASNLLDAKIALLSRLINELRSGRLLKKDSTPIPPVTLQNSPGSAVSLNQQGGITAGQVNIGDIPKRISESDMRTIVSFLSNAKQKRTISVTAAIGGNAGLFADDLYKAFKDSGWAMRENAVNSLMTPLTSEARSKGAADIYVKGEPLKDGESVSINEPDPLFYVYKVLEAYKLPLNLKRSHDLDDSIDIQIISLPR